ncbi:MAG: hypothetical protein Fur0010_27560 [Bdellovibrio sp.]
MTTLSERQQREKEYYEKYANTFDLDTEIDFAPIDGPMSGRERRPWNSYWRTYELLIDFWQNAQSQNLRLLDFGCGPGDNSLRFSRIGFHVTGFDISESNIKNCYTLFEKNKMSERGEFLVSVAEKLPFENETFDVVAGIDILHHVDIPKAMLEVRRVLKEGGIAVFREPIEVPFLDWIRNSKLVTFFVPNQASLENHITEDERKLNRQDFINIAAVFPDMKIERSLILSRFDKFIIKKSNKKASTLEKIDMFLSRIIPGYSKLGGAVVIKLVKSS